MSSLPRTQWQLDNLVTVDEVSKFAREKILVTVDEVSKPYKFAARAYFEEHFIYYFFYLHLFLDYYLFTVWLLSISPFEAMTLNRTKLVRALKRNKAGRWRDLVDEEDGLSALRVKHERKLPLAGRALLRTHSASLEKVSKGASLDKVSNVASLLKGSERAIAPDAHMVISSVPGSSTSSILAKGVKYFPGKYVPNWLVTTNDFLLGDPDTAAALLRGSNPWEG